MGIQLLFMAVVASLLINLTQETNYSSLLLNDPRSEAMLVLENKCNSCHQKQNRRRVFTLDNIDGFAPDIYK